MIKVFILIRQYCIKMLSAVFNINLIFFTKQYYQNVFLFCIINHYLIIKKYLLRRTGKRDVPINQNGPKTMISSKKKKKIIKLSPQKARVYSPLRRAQGGTTKHARRQHVSQMFSSVHYNDRLNWALVIPTERDHQSQVT